jgi:hypothetical protein
VESAGLGNKPPDGLEADPLLLRLLAGSMTSYIDVLHLVCLRGAGASSILTRARRSFLSSVQSALVENMARSSFPYSYNLVMTL